jgi:DNA mismatch repair protein MutS2
MWGEEEKDKKKEAIKEGDFVKMKTGGATGTVESIDKSKAVVRMGEMRMTIKVRDLQHANAPLEVQNTKSVKSQTATDAATFEPKLDIRGMRYEEALKVVEDFVDQALIANAAHLEIVHGKGSGALREAVRRKLREYKVPMDISHPPKNEGAMV